MSTEKRKPSKGEIWTISTPRGWELLQFLGREHSISVFVRTCGFRVVVICIDLNGLTVSAGDARRGSVGGFVMPVELFTEMFTLQYTTAEVTELGLWQKALDQSTTPS